MEGTILGNRYKIIRKIGDGGMAFVYEAKDMLLKRVVAVKVLRPEFADDKEFLSKFKREAEAVANITHPNIVNVYDVGQEEKVHYIVMEYVDGQNLKDIIRNEGVLDEYTALDITKQIAQALSAAHRKGVIHRDIKPHNILISNEGRQVKVADFGIAKAVSNSTITQIGSIIGSVHYFSPEQAKGQYISKNADLYSLGIVLYEMIIGRVPFRGDSPISIALQHINEDIKFTQDEKTRIPHSVRTLIKKLTEKLPEDRYQSAEDVIDDIEYIEKNIDLDFIKEYDNYVTQKIYQEKIIAESKIQKDNKSQIEEEYLNNYSSYDEYENDEYEEEVDYSNTRGSKNKNKNNRKKKDDDDKKPKGKKVIIVFIVIIFVVTGGYFGLSTVSEILGNGQSGNSESKVNKIPVPNFVGQHIDSVSSQASELKLRLQQTEEYSAEIKAGYVISQTPSTGTIEEGDIITVVVSLGGKEATVPNCIGFSFDRAKALIEEHKLIVGSRSYQYSDTYEEGVVITQSPLAGTTGILENSNVTLVISRGKKPSVQDDTNNNNNNETNNDENNNDNQNNNNGTNDDENNNGNTVTPPDEGNEGGNLDDGQTGDGNQDNDQNDDTVVED